MKGCSKNVEFWGVFIWFRSYFYYWIKFIQHIINRLNKCSQNVYQNKCLPTKGFLFANECAAMVKLWAPQRTVVGGHSKTLATVEARRCCYMRVSALSLCGFAFTTANILQVAKKADGWIAPQPSNLLARECDISESSLLFCWLNRSSLSSLTAARSQHSINHSSIYVNIVS